MTTDIQLQAADYAAQPDDRERWDAELAEMMEAAPEEWSAEEVLRREG